MKIVLSEQQICELVILEGLYNSSDVLLTENFNLNNLKMKIKRLLIAGVAVSSILFTIDKIHLNMTQKAELEAFTQMENEKIEQERIKQDSICNTKIEACEKYMTKALANQGFNRDSTKLTAEALVKTAGEYSFDLRYLPIEQQTFVLTVSKTGYTSANVEIAVIKKEDGKYVKLSKDEVTSYIESVLAEEETEEDVESEDLEESEE